MQHDQDKDFLNAEVRVPRLELRLLQRNGGALGEKVQISVDRVNNSQHLYIKNLAAGEYAMEIRRTDQASSAAEYALAWDPVETPAAEHSATFAEWREAFFSEPDLQDPKSAGRMPIRIGTGSSTFSNTPSAATRTCRTVRFSPGRWS